MGSSSSKLEKALVQQLPETVRLCGLENFGNTCYCNSVLQALYFCEPFRNCILEHVRTQPAHHVLDRAGRHSDDDGETMLSCLAELFQTIQLQKKKMAVVKPNRFIQRLRKENELFRGFMHQDAHEFLNYLLNDLISIVRKEQCRADGTAESSSAAQPTRTFVQDIFEGLLTSETKCLTCETVTSKEEPFLDLSLDIEENSSITSCLRKFSSVETLDDNNKFFCDTCCALQEAHKSMKVKSLPPILALHLKRFKFIESLQRFKKLSYRVVFPHELKIVNTVESTAEHDKEYSLFAVVIHVGSGAQHGHYISLVKIHQQWLAFDDDVVMLVDESDVPAYFGTTKCDGTADVAYILFYQRADLDALEQSP